MRPRAVCSSGPRRSAPGAAPRHGRAARRRRRAPPPAGRSAAWRDAPPASSITTPPWYRSEPISSRWRSRGTMRTVRPLAERLDLPPQGAELRRVAGEQEAASAPVVDVEAARARSGPRGSRTRRARRPSARCRLGRAEAIGEMAPVELDRAADHAAVATAGALAEAPASSTATRTPARARVNAADRPQ